MPKGEPRGWPPGPGGQVARPPPDCVRQAPGRGLDPLRPSFGLLESSDLDIFWGIFMNFSEHFYFSPFSAMHEQKQTETGTGH